jgi:hypothetical protein
MPYSQDSLIKYFFAFRSSSRWLTAIRISMLHDSDQYVAAGLRDKVSDVIMRPCFSVVELGRRSWCSD